jgi:hypothetical protein
MWLHGGRAPATLLLDDCLELVRSSGDVSGHLVSEHGAEHDEQCHAEQPDPDHGRTVPANRSSCSCVRPLVPRRRLAVMTPCHDVLDGHIGRSMRTAPSPPWGGGG